MSRSSAMELTLLHPELMVNEVRLARLAFHILLRERSITRAFNYRVRVTIQMEFHNGGRNLSWSLKRELRLYFLVLFRGENEFGPHPQIEVLVHFRGSFQNSP